MAVDKGKMTVDGHPSAELLEEQSCLQTGIDAELKLVRKQEETLSMPT